MTYAVPADLTKGKQKVTVTFQAHSGSTAGGAFGCRILTGTKWHEHGHPSG